MMKRCFALLCCLLLMAVPALAEDDKDLDDVDWDIEEFVDLGDDGEEIPTETPQPTVSNPARDDLIDRILATGEALYIKADGRAQRAHYSGDIYVCKNFTTHVFRENSGDFRMAEYPDVKLIIPDNLPKDECAPYYYGFLWKDIPASQGNPFEVAAQFRYNLELSREENLALAIEFMKQVRKGDFFQMSADYDYGVGAHSAIMIADYDPETETVHWMDSNMLGQKRNGERYGYVQYDAEKSIEWWAKAFCVRKRGATIYRLRDDIVYAEQVQ